MLGILRGLEPCLFHWKCHKKGRANETSKNCCDSLWPTKNGGAVSVEKWEKKEPNNANIRLHYDGYIIPAYGGCSHGYAVIPIKITLYPNLCWLQPWFYHPYTHLNQAKCTVGCATSKTPSFRRLKLEPDVMLLKLLWLGSSVAAASNRFEGQVAISSVVAFWSHPLGISRIESLLTIGF